MGFNTFPCNPYPISTEELNKGNNDDLNTRVAALESDVSDLNSQKANQITIAPFFDPETSYEVGDLVYYNGLSYRCTNDHEGEWDADDFAATTVAGELATLKSGLTNLVTIVDVPISGTLAANSGEVVPIATADLPLASKVIGLIAEVDTGSNAVMVGNIVNAGTQYIVHTYNTYTAELAYSYVLHVAVLS